MKFLFKPVKNYWVTQSFAQDEACISLEDKKTVLGKVNGVCPAGSMSLYAHLGMMKGHTGLDIMAPTGTSLHASQNGFVEEIQTEEARGLGVGIITKDKFFCDETGNDEHFKIRYWHLKTILVSKNQEVKIGDMIGIADNTGYSAGAHLHFEIKPVRKNSKNQWYNVLQTNSFFGAVNPAPYMEDISALDFAGLIKKVLLLTASVAEFVANYLRK